MISDESVLKLIIGYLNFEITHHCGISHLMSHQRKNSDR